MKQDSRRFAGERGVVVSLVLSIAMIIVIMFTLFVWKHLASLSAVVQSAIQWIGVVEQGG
jgi:hypothetical protein